MQLQIYMAKAYNAVGRFDDALRMIKATGVLDNFANGRRGTEGIDASMVVLNAAYGSGAVEEAREFNRLTADMHYRGDTTDWWVAVQLACMSAIMGDDDEVYRRFKETSQAGHESRLGADTSRQRVL